MEGLHRQVADLQDNSGVVVVDNTEAVLVAVDNTDIAEDTAVVGVPSDIED